MKLIVSARVLLRFAPAALLGAAGCMGNVPLPQRPAPPAVSALVAQVSAPSPIRQAQYVEAPPPPVPAAERPQVITLPQAIHECLYSNLRIQAKGEKVH